MTPGMSFKPIFISVFLLPSIWGALYWFVLDPRHENIISFVIAVGAVPYTIFSVVLIVCAKILAEEKFRKITLFLPLLFGALCGHGVLDIADTEFTIKKVFAIGKISGFYSVSGYMCLAIAWLLYVTINRINNAKL